MKKIIAIFLLLQFLTNNSFAEEVIKLPKLFTHFHHHTHQHHDKINFIDYLVQHYHGNHETTDHNNNDDDCNLPFKHCNGCCVNTHAPGLAFVSYFQEANIIFTIAISRKYSFENEKIKSMCSPPVWQPPKVA